MIFHILELIIVLFESPRMHAASITSQPLGMIISHRMYLYTKATTVVYTVDNRSTLDE